MNERVKEFVKAAGEDFQAALISSDVNRFYFTGFSSSAGYVFITPEKTYLLVDFRYYEKALLTVSGFEIIKLENFKNQINELISKHGVTSLSLESCITMEDFKSFENSFNTALDFKTGISKIIRKMRSVKSLQEILAIKKALSISEKAFEETLSYIKTGVTERDIAAELEYRMRKLGADRIAFETISVSGANSSLPHGKASDKKIQSGDFLTLDFGAVKDGYCSDITRTVAIGEISDEQKRVYQTVREAQQKAFEKIRPGVKCCEVDAAAREYIGASGYEGLFGHGLGHSVGIELHEAPHFSPKDETVLEKGMVITVEPGIYIPGQFGVRIENMIAVSDEGFENLTKAKTDLIIL